MGRRPYDPMADFYKVTGLEPDQTPGVHTGMTRRSQFVVTSIIPLGWAFRGLRTVHHGIKGVRYVPRAKQYQSLHRVYGARGRPWVGRADYARRAGLPTELKVKYGQFKVAERKVKKFVRGIPVVGQVVKFRSRLHFIRDPVLWTAKRVPGLGLGIAGYGLWKRYEHLLVTNGNGPNPEQSDRVKLVPNTFNQFDGAGEPLPPRVRPSLSPQRRRKSKSQGRCPPGHRWSSKLKKCVRYRRRR